ncbi:DUF192 domain-containing protein [Candidatus Woesearchaeota archaeon]|nr:DUF192 domain-containing protein [Candidatus Woesearchaeota archaeon]
MEVTHNNKVLAKKVKCYTNIFSKSLGLRFAKPLEKGQALILAAEKESISETMIDMLFVFFPIDVLWLNERKEVVDIKKSVKPFTPLLIPKKPAKYVIELKAGSTDNIIIGDRLRF